MYTSDLISSQPDRYIPCRNDTDLSNYQLENSANNVQNSNTEYKTELMESLFEGHSIESKILTYKKKAPVSRDNPNFNNLRILYSQNKTKSNAVSAVNRRHIPQNPERTLDAPGVTDDYYINILDWNRNNLLAVGLGKSLYIWNASSGQVNELMSTSSDSDFITSVNWSADGNFLAVGTESSTLQLWDVEKNKKLRTLKGHNDRVGSLSWNGHILSSGSRDTRIINHDVRVREHVLSTIDCHSGEICGLKWSPDGLQLASGSNDNIINIFDNNVIVPNTESILPQFTFNDHTGAVKALAWAPFQSGLLASGGGSTDRCIKFWNTKSGIILDSVDTGSQVCSLQWSIHSQELCSSHGFAQNQISVWKYPSLCKLADLTAHSSRVLHTALSPDGCTVASLAADDTLRFWKIFESASTIRRPTAVSTKQTNLSTSKTFQSNQIR